MAPPAGQNAPIIIRKVQAAAEEVHHGGAWKVAYADFVTAMMAFFLLMWLLNATTEDQRKGIADYFDPDIPISRVSAGGSDMFKGESTFAQEQLARTGTGGSGRDGAAGNRENAPSEVDVQGEPYDHETPEMQKVANTDTDVEALQRQIELRIDQQDPAAQLVKHLRFTMTPDGLRIDIVDDEDTAMFETASAHPTDRMKLILSVVASVLTEVENDLSIAGHTDARPYRNPKGYSNWELSSDRAHAARRSLIDNGLQTSHFVRVEGHGSRTPLDKTNRLAVQNRRISITVLWKNAG
jgi:chemotaxis protein MotB